MPESPFQASVSDFVSAAKAASIGSVRNTIQDGRRIAASADNLPQVAGVLAVTLPVVISLPVYFFAKGLLGHVADALDESAAKAGSVEHEAQPAQPEQQSQTAGQPEKAADAQAT